MTQEKKYQPSNIPLLCLLQLSFSSEAGRLKNTELLGKLVASKRNQLVDAGFITVNNKVKPMELELTDFGWGWIEDNIDSDLAFGTSKAVGAILKLLIKRTKPLRDKGLCFSDFSQEGKLEPAITEHLLPQANTALDKAELTPSHPQSTRSDQDIFKMAEDAYLELSHGKSNVRVYLKDLKEKLQYIPSQDLNKILFDAHCDSDKNLVLYPLDDRSSITPEDSQAAVSVEGCDFHILYMERTA